MFPQMVTQMIDIGEETGRMSDMLIKVATFYDQEVEVAVKALTSLIEPALIIFLGGIVGFIVASIMVECGCFSILVSCPLRFARFCMMAPTHSSGTSIQPVS